MKKLLTVLLALMLILSGFVSPRAALAEEPAFQTIGDILGYDSVASASYEDLYIRIFTKDGTVYRADADLTAELFVKLLEIDFFDPDKVQKEKALLGDLPIRQLYNLSDVLLPQEALDSLVGMSGQDLLDMGFVPSGSYGFGEDVSMAFLEKGPFEYQFDFAESVASEEDPNVAETIRPLTVASAAYTGNVSDYATEHDFDPNGGRTLAEYEADYAVFHTTVTPETIFGLTEIPPEEFEFKTLGEALALDSEQHSSGWTEDTFYYVFDRDGAYYRIECPITPELIEQIDALDFFADDYNERFNAIVGGQPIQRVVDLTPGIATPEELNEWIGVTGQDLLDMGFRVESYSFEKNPELYMAIGFYEYRFTFKGKVAKQDDYDAVLNEILPDLTVKKAEFVGLTSEAGNPDYGMAIWNQTEEEPVYEPVVAEGVVEIPVEESSFKTLADVFALDPEPAFGMDENRYVTVFNADGIFYRVEADMTAEIYEKLGAIDFFDEARDKKYAELLKDLPVTRVANLSAGIPPQEELDALKGMTGTELMQLGFDYGSGYSFYQKATVYFVRGIYEYCVTFAETVPEMEDYDAVMDELMQSLTVEKIEFYNLAQCCLDADLVY